MSRSTYTTIMFGLEDTSANEDGVFTSTDYAPFSIFSQLFNESNKLTPIQTCEPNMTILDGTRQVLDENASQQYGYYSSSVSDENGNFETNPKLIRTFVQDHSTPSVIFYFAEEGRPKQIAMRFYKNDVLLTSALFDVDSDEFTARKSCKNYNKFEIEFIGTYVPNRHIKFAEIFYGEYLIWDRENITSANVIEEFDLISDELPIGQLEFSIFDENDDFNILNPSGSYTSLQQKQKILVTETVNGVEYEYGTYYLDTWENTQGKLASFVAKDALSLLDDVTFKQSYMYNNEKVSNIIGQIMGVANFGNYEIDTELGNKKLSGYIPICTCREAIQYVCIATSCCVFCNKKGILSFKKFPIGTEKVEIKRDRKWNTKVTQNDIVNYVSVEGYVFEKDTASSELYRDTLSVGTYEVNLSEPATDFSITENATIIESNVNYVSFEVTTAGEIIISGKKYIQYSNVVVSQAESIIRKKQIEITGIYLINFLNAKDVADYIYNYYQRRLLETFTLVNNLEKLGENVQVDLELNQTKNGIITRMETDLTGGFLSETTVTNEV